MSWQVIPLKARAVFPGSQPNSGHGDYSRLSCAAVTMQLWSWLYGHERQPNQQHVARIRLAGRRSMQLRINRRLIERSEFHGREPSDHEKRRAAKRIFPR
jgi:hypothetical protein